MNPHLTMLQNTNCVLNFNYYYGKVEEQYLKTTFSVKKKEKFFYFFTEKKKKKSESFIVQAKFKILKYQ